jgi:hypothetical protein
VVTVIACIYDRPNSREFVEKLLKSKLDNGAILRIEICNNMESRQAELEAMAIAEAQKTAYYHTVTIHKMEQNDKGFSRFLLARKLMHARNLEYVVMVDDDQYVKDSTIAKIYAEREKLRYKTCELNQTPKTKLNLTSNSNSPPFSSPRSFVCRVRQELDKKR